MTDSHVQDQSLRLAFAKALAMRRVRLGMTQTELAQLLKMKRGYIGALESGKVNVSLDTVMFIRSALWPQLEPLNVKVEFGKRIVEVRSGRFTQEALSGLTQLSVPFISSLERGLSNTSLDQIATLSAALNFDALTWMGREWFGFSNLEDDDWRASFAVGQGEKEASGTLREVVAEDLRKLRKSLDVTQDELAKRLGITKGRVSQIELAKSNLSLNTVEQVVKALTGSQHEESAEFAVMVAERVAVLRKRLGISQTALAEKSNLSRPTISRIERADGSTSIDQLEAVTRALTLKGRELLEGLYPLVVSERLPTKSWLLHAVEALSRRQS